MGQKLKKVTFIQNDLQVFKKVVVQLQVQGRLRSSLPACMTFELSLLVDVQIETNPRTNQ